MALPEVHHHRREKPLTQTSPFAPALGSYLANINFNLGRKTEADLGLEERILDIVDRNNQIAAMLESDAYQAILEAEKALKGEAKLGIIVCIDGRVPTIHVAGKAANVWEEPASIIETEGTGQGRVPVSPGLGEPLRNAARDGRDVLEIALAHTSLSTTHKCGKMAGLQQAYVKGEQTRYPVPPDVPLEYSAIALLEENVVPAIHNLTNRFRIQNNREPQSRVAMTALLDTDTFGIHLNYGTDHAFSTTDFIRVHGGEMERDLVRPFPYGMMRESFNSPDHFLQYSQNVLTVTKRLMAWPKFAGEVDSYLSREYQDMTADQIQALRFLLARTMATQYMTGLATQGAEGEHPEHPFAEHEEAYMAVSLEGKMIGRYDFEQVFASSPSDEHSAVDHVRTKLFLMDAHDAVTAGPHEPRILFVSNPIDKKAWERHKQEFDNSVSRAYGRNARLFRHLAEDEVIRNRMKQGDVIIVPVFTDQETGEVLEVIDQSAYLSYKEESSP